MCGIAGIFDLTGKPVESHEIGRMLDTIRHRGPDGEGIWCEGPIGLGHRRLSIIDLEGGHQPMGNEDGSVQVSFNGEIYNHHSIAERLRSRHQFRTRSDTEVIVHLYEERGADLVDELQGFFAFALWDQRRRRLILARDRIGKKPLFVARTSQRLYFASEVKALLAVPEIHPRLDPQALNDVLALRYVRGTRSGLLGVERLEPGHVRIVDQNSDALRRYWNVPASSPQSVSFEDAVLDFRTQLDLAVERRLESDVPLGLLLSGGLDSTAVLESMVRVSPGRVSTFTLAFSKAEESEAQYGRVAAEHFGTDHHELPLSEHQLVEQVSELLPRLDEPFADSSILPTALICKRARGEVTVCLTGDGGDELFGGYTRYSTVLANDADALSGWRRALAEHMLLQLPLHNLKAWKLASRLRGALNGQPGRYVEALASSDARVRTSVLGPVALESVSPEALESELRAPLERPGNFAGLMMEHDLGNFLPGMVLRKVDLASMMNSLEIRSPLLDHQLIEWAARIPVEYKIAGSKRKRLLRASLEGRVPRVLLERGKKGFGSPVGRWLRHELRPFLESQLSRSRLARDGWLDQRGLDALLRAHASRSHKMNDLIWSLLSTEVWYRTWVIRES